MKNSEIIFVGGAALILFSFKRLPRGIQILPAIAFGADAATILSAESEIDVGMGAVKMIISTINNFQQLF